MVVEMLSDLTEEGASEPSDFDLDNYLDIVQQEQDQDLYLDNRNLSTLPSKLLREAAAFTQLTRLHLRNNNLDTLPNEIGKLTGLLELNVHDNKLKELPKGIGSLNILETLDVSSNLLSHLPSCIGRLNSLDSLLVSDNKLVAIPKEVCTLRSLRVLSAMNNKIRSLPLEIALCCSLTRLLLDRNCLRWLPRELCALPHLEEISVCKNQLLCLPIDLGTASRLKSVYLDNNAYLHAVPISISPLEVGFHSCGMDNYKPVDFEEEYYNYITVDGDEAEPEKKIFVPLEMKVLGKKQSFLVPSLLEISLKAVERYHKKDKPYPPRDLPLGLHLTLSAPVATCTMCHAPIYTSAYPVLFEAQIHLYRLLRLVLCCSSGCVFRAARYTVLPLVYPDPDLLLMTVALVQN